MKRSIFVVAVLLLSVVASWAQEKAAQPRIGWRGDGTGKYPSATPPTEWGRWPKGPLHNLVTSADKAKDAAKPNEDAKPLEAGLIIEWLAVGPFAVDADKPLDKECIANEAALDPAAGEKVGELAWNKAIARKRGEDQGVDLDYLFLGDLTKGAKDQVAYASANLYAQEEGKVVFVFDHSGAMKMWVNGQVAYNNPKTHLSLWALNNITWAMGNGTLPPFGIKAQRLTVDLKKGWNRVLIKGTNSVHLRLTATPDTQYDGKNIVWATSMPSYSNAAPVIAGDKIFVMAEQDELVCVNKADGKILWRRSNNFYDATPQAERDKNPAFKEKIEPLQEKLMAATTFDEKVALRKQMLDALAAIDKAKYQMLIEGHPTSHRLVGGWTTPTPCYDGKYVYVWVTNCVAACYDLDGNRQWITRCDGYLQNPKSDVGPFRYPCSPELIGGKFIVSVGPEGTAALNAADGTLAWKILGLGPCIPNNCSGTINGVDVFFTGGGTAVRASDGKVLYSGNLGNLQGPPTFVDGTLWCYNLAYTALDFSKCTGDEFTPEKKLYNYPGMCTYSSALIHDGLIYNFNRNGLLYVWDTKTNGMAFQKQLDVTPMINYNAAGMGSSPTLAGKYVYIFDNQGHCIVLEAGREFKQVARNTIQTYIPDRDHPMNPLETCTYANPVFEGSRMYVRAEQYLYCIGEK